MNVKDIKKIDIHAHATPFPEYAPIQFTGERLVSAEEVIAFYDELNIEKGVLLPLSSAEWHDEQFTSSDCKYLVDKHPGRFLWFCNVDPRAVEHSPKADLSRILNHYKSLGAKGVGEVTAQLYFDDPMMDNLFHHCEMCDLPVTIHIAPKQGDYYGIVDDLGLPRLEKTLKKHKDLKILGHSQCFWSQMGDNVDEENRFFFPTGKVQNGRIPQLMREYGNLYCDFSANSGMNALMRDPEHAARFIEEFSDRVLYGCDICNPSNRHQYQFNDFLNKMLADKMISEENYYKLVRGNAVKLLKLEEN